MSIHSVTDGCHIPIHLPAETNKVFSRVAPIPKLGDCTIPSPLEAERFISDDKVVYQEVLATVEEKVTIPTNTDKTNPTLSRLSGEFCTYELAGPRSHLYFPAATTTMAVVTCGGLCPGMNNVIRHIVLCAWHRYGIRNIIGLKYGFQGLNPKISERIQLTPQVVKDIHRFGGSLLGVSRGPQPVPMMADFIIENKIDILFVIGGDGSARGCLAIAQELSSRQALVSIILIPKTIDNDIVCTDRTFGFETAVQQSQQAITAAHGEARSAENGIGIVKLMGRESGFIALHAALASGDANLVLLPEVPFTIDGIIRYLQQRFTTSNHCVIVMAEGAGQNTIIPTSGATDKSGNMKLSDIGIYIKQELEHRLKALNIPTTIKYIDPSYMIRCAEADAADALYCMGLAHGAVHAAMTGRTNMLISHWNGEYVHVPLECVGDKRKFVNPYDTHYQLLLDTTGQPRNMT